MGRAFTKAEIIKKLKSLISIKKTRPLSEKSKPRIVCSAMKLKGGMIICGPRHFDNIMRAQLVACKKSKLDVKTQGFIDQFGTFYTRGEACKLAKANGQIRYRCGADENQLYSENLY